MISSIVGGDPFVALLLPIIPFVFNRYGHWIQSNSPFSQLVMKGELTGERVVEGEHVV